VVFFDALRIKSRDEGNVRSKAVYLALGILPNGAREIDLHARGCDDILIAVTDGLTGMPEALAASDPRTTLQTCIVHLLRNSSRMPAGKSASRSGGAPRDLSFGQRRGRSCRSMRFRPRYGACFTPPMPWRACMRACERSSNPWDVSDR
jgi:hypothetical protein